MLQKQTITKLIDSLQVSADSTQIGVIVYAKYSSTVIPIGSFVDKKNLLNSIESLQNPGDGSRLDRALALASIVLKQARVIGINQKLVVMVDTKSEVDPKPWANQLVNNDVDITVIGFGNEELDKISNGKHMKIADTADVDDAVKTMLKNIISGTPSFFL